MHKTTYIMNFKLHGEPHLVTPNELTEWLECDYETMLNTLLNFNQSDV